ncbi:Uncharacterized protein APZ42_006495, partial [Daphnia magna]
MPPFLDGELSVITLVESCSRRRVPQTCSSRRLETIHIRIQKNSSDVEDGSRLIRQRMECATSNIRQPFPSAGRMDDGRIYIELEVFQSLRLPLVQLNRELPNEVDPGEGNNNSNNTILAEPTL